MDLPTGGKTVGLPTPAAVIGGEASGPVGAGEAAPTPSDLPTSATIAGMPGLGPLGDGLPSPAEAAGLGPSPAAPPESGSADPFGEVKLGADPFGDLEEGGRQSFPNIDSFDGRDSSLPPPAPSGETMGGLGAPPVQPGADVSRPSGTTRVQASGSTDFGEIDLGPGPDENSGEFDAFPVKEDSGLSFGDDLGAAPSAETAAAPVPPMEGDPFGGVDDKIDVDHSRDLPDEPGSLIDDGVPAEERISGDRKPLAHFEGRRRLERQSRRSKVVVLLLLVIVGAVGGGLSFTPYGPFGAYAIAKLLPSAGDDELVRQFTVKLRRRLQDDTMPQLTDALRELDVALKESPDNEDLRLLGVFLNNWWQIRFGESKKHETRANRLLGSINLGESESGWAPLARASQHVITGKADAVEKSVQRLAGANPDAAALLAEGYLVAGMDDKAQPVVAGLLTKESSPRARYLEARILSRQQEKHGEALEKLSQLVAAAPGHTDAMLLKMKLALGQKQLDVGQVEQTLLAVAGMSDKNTTFRQRARASALLGRMYLAERHLTKAKAVFDKAAELDPEDPVLLVGRGNLALFNEDYSAASTYFTQAAVGDPGDVQAILGQAEANLKRAQLSEAKKIVSDMLPHHAKNPRAHYLLGMVERALKNNDAAEREFGTAIAIDKEFIEAYVALSELYLSLDRDQDALRTLDEAAETVPNSPLIAVTLADAHAKRGDFAASIVELGKAIDQDPDFLKAHFRMAQMYRRMGETEDAARSLREVENRNPSYPGLALEQGLLLEVTGKLDDALAAYTRALNAEPENQDLKIRVGATAHLLGDNVRAEDLLGQVLGQDPQSPEANFYMGEVYRTTGRIPESMPLLKLAQTLDETNALFHLRFGMTLMALRDMGEARRQLERAAELEPERAEIYLRIGELELREGSARNAIKSLDHALTLDPGLAEAYGFAGDAFEQLSDMRSAVANYRRAVKQVPDNADLWFKLALVELQVHGNKVGASSFATAVRLGDEMEEKPKWFPEALYRLGAARASSGNKGEAIRAFKRYLEVAPEDDIDRREVLAYLDRLGAR